MVTQVVVNGSQYRFIDDIGLFVSAKWNVEEAVAIDTKQPIV